MKRIIVSLAVVLATMFMTLCLQGCFYPYDGRDDRGGRHREDSGEYPASRETQGWGVPNHYDHRR